MLACDYCKKAHHKIRSYHAAWAVVGPTETDHDLLQHVWELCPDCAARACGEFRQVIDKIAGTAPGKRVERMSNPIVAGDVTAKRKFKELLQGDPKEP